MIQIPYISVILFILCFIMSIWIWKTVKNQSELDRMTDDLSDPIPIYFGVIFALAIVLNFFVTYFLGDMLII
jgi:sterol desaturase/sphingolipid hydroxylase (fatty acid hydroxylase superfamily)